MTDQQELSDFCSESESRRMGRTAGILYEAMHAQEIGTHKRSTGFYLSEFWATLRDEGIGAALRQDLIYTLARRSEDTALTLAGWYARLTNWNSQLRSDD